VRSDYELRQTEIRAKQDVEEIKKRREVVFWKDR
jgi:hypothetical protein